MKKRRPSWPRWALLCSLWVLLCSPCFSADSSQADVVTMPRATWEQLKTEFSTLKGALAELQLQLTESKLALTELRTQLGVLQAQLATSATSLTRSIETTRAVAAERDFWRIAAPIALLAGLGAGWALPIRR